MFHDYSTEDFTTVMLPCSPVKLKMLSDLNKRDNKFWIGSVPVPTQCPATAQLDLLGLLLTGRIYDTSSTALDHPKSLLCSLLQTGIAVRENSTSEILTKYSSFFQIRNIWSLIICPFAPVLMAILFSPNLITCFLIRQSTSHPHKTTLSQVRILL